MTKKMIDLSVPMDNRLKEPFPPKIKYDSHANGAKQAAGLLGLKASDFPNNEAWATETVTLTTHTGTHIDAPWHYASTAAGKPARTIDQLPIEWFYGDGVLFDFSDKHPGYEIQTQDLTDQLEEMNYELKPLDIVLIRTDTDQYIYTDEYLASQPGMSADATRWLIEQGIKVMGIDGWGWDIPLALQAENYKQNPREGVLWAAHFVGKEAEYCQIEKLANLDQLPTQHGFKVAAFPIKITGASAGWVRPVAIIE
ncbi:cyclase family protein [Geomicrobium sp. JSM 1781026]|uniref:cyclase family protein n=1 Tax=Geomicrobium sp. JSM 1781026 TaxID=3344580 RepID=UPI0035C1E9F3